MRLRRQSCCRQPGRVRRLVLSVAYHEGYPAPVDASNLPCAKSARAWSLAWRPR